MCMNYRLMVNSQKFISSISLLGTEGHIGIKKESLRQDVIYFLTTRGGLVINNLFV